MTITTADWDSWTTLWSQDKPVDIEHGGNAYKVHMNVVGPVVAAPPMPEGMDDKCIWVFMRIKVAGKPILRMDAPMKQKNYTQEELQRIFELWFGWICKMNHSKRDGTGSELDVAYIKECVKLDNEWAEREKHEV